jgi:hypothetical protein
MSLQRRVVCAANRHRETGLIICGARHYDPIMRAVMKQLGGWPYWNNVDQGFIDQRGVFMEREEALRVALAAGQRAYRCGGDEQTLYSENLY